MWRGFVTAFVAILVTIAVASGITYRVMDAKVREAEQRVSERISTAQVDAYNDGFMDGVCRNGMDGLGMACDE